MILFVAFSIECNLSCDLNISSHEYDACDFNSLFLVNPRTGFTLAQQNCGLEVHKSAFEDQPYVFYPDAREDFKYTIIMVDEDNPMSEDGNIFLQWMIMNVDGLALKYGVGHNYGEIFAGNDSKEILLNFNSITISSLSPSKSIARLMRPSLFNLHLRTNFKSIGIS